MSGGGAAREEAGVVAGTLETAPGGAGLTAGPVERRLVEELRSLRELEERDPFVNPVPLLGLHIKRQLDDGSIDEAGLKELVRSLVMQACLRRAETPCASSSAWTTRRTTPVTG